MSFAKVYPMYVAKAEKKGRTKHEVDEIIEWLTGYDAPGLQVELEKGTDLETLFTESPRPNPSRRLIKGVVCGVRVEEVQEPTMQESGVLRGASALLQQLDLLVHSSSYRSGHDATPSPFVPVGAFLGGRWCPQHFEEGCPEGV